MNFRRSRNWSFVGYPEDSLPSDYAAILTDEYHLIWAESPVHDADLNGDGSEKKKHIHFILSFDGMKSFEQIKEITDRLSCPIPQVCRSVRGLVRYFVHLDNPDKAQYSPSEIKCHGGFEIEEYFTKSKAELRDVLRQIFLFIEDNNIDSFYQLSKIVWELNDPDWIDIVCSRNSIYLNAVLKDKHFRILEERNRREL